VHGDETRAATEIMTTPSESLLLHFVTGVMRLLSDAVFIPKYAGNDPPKNRVSPNTFSIASPELIKAAKKLKNFITTRVNYELSNETNETLY
jgi:hypothetical protein